MKMRLVPAGEQNSGRVNAPQRSKPPGSEFSLEAFPLKDNRLETPEVAPSRREPEPVYSLVTTEVIDEAAVQPTGSEEQEGIMVDEQALAEGVKLFGSLFSLIEERLASGNRKPEQKEVPPTQVDEKAASAIAITVENAGKNNRAHGVVIDLAQIRGRIASSKVRLQSEDQRRSLLEPRVPVAYSRVTPTGKNQPVKEAADLEAASKNRDFDKTSVSEGIATHDSRAIEALQSLNPETELPPAQTAIAPPRIDQIVRTVIEQTQQKQAAQSVSDTQQFTANVTGRTLRMSLHPLELGSVEITVSKRGKRLEVTVSPELAATGKLLVEDASALALRLGASDPGVEHVHIRIMLADGTVEIHDVNDALQFQSRQNSSFTSHEYDPPSTNGGISQQREESSENDRGAPEKPSVSLSHRQSGAVYI